MKVFGWKDFVSVRVRHTNRQPGGAGAVRIANGAFWGQHAHVDVCVCLKFPACTMGMHHIYKVKFKVIGLT